MLTDSVTALRYVWFRRHEEGSTMVEASGKAPTIALEHLDAMANSDVDTILSLSADEVASGAPGSRQRQEFS